jgi:flagellar hook-associated protein 2
MSSVSAVNTLLSGTATTTPSINISSILAASSGSAAAGIDVTSAVAAAIYADRAPERIWQADQTTLTSQTSDLTAIQTATAAVETDMQSLNTLTGSPLSARTVSSSDNTYVTATAADGTTLGDHTVVVNSLAATSAWYSDLESSATTTLPTSSITITTGGASVSFATGVNATTSAKNPGDTLADLATAINSATTSTGAKLGLTATVITDSTGSRLAIIANSSGAAANFSVSEPYTSWTAPELPAGDSLGANNIILTSAAGTATITTTSGESYSDLATAITNATVSTGYSSALAPLTATTALTEGSVTTIDDASTGDTFTYTATAGSTVASLNSAIAAAVTAHTLPANVIGTITGGNEVISGGTSGTGITVSTGDSVLGPMAAAPSATGIAPSSYSTALGPLTATTALTTGSVTTIDDASTGNTFTYTAIAGSTVASLNNAISAAVTAGTLSANVAGTISGGNEVISEGSSDQGITVSTNDSVLGTVGAVPSATKPLGLTAIATGSPGSNTFLTITGNSVTTGIPPTTTITPFTINEPSASDTTFAFTQAVAGADASLTVDGVPIDSASNTVIGAIPGITLSLLSPTSGSAVDLAVGSNASAISTTINQFVTDYNTAIGLVNAQFTVSSSTNSAGVASSAEGVLASDPALIDLQSALEQVINYTSAPVTGSTTTVSSLNDLGITAGDDGTLSVDSTTLDNALTNNPNDVQNFFEGASLNGFASSLTTSLNAFSDPANGAFTVDLTSMSNQSADLTSEISDFETGYIAGQQTILTAEFSSAEVALQQLPEQMQQLNSELGFNSNGSSSG